MNYKCGFNGRPKIPIKQSLERESPIHAVANSIISYPENAEGRFEDLEELKLSEI